MNKSSSATAENELVLEGVMVEQGFDELLSFMRNPQGCHLASSVREKLLRAFARRAITINENTVSVFRKSRTKYKEPSWEPEYWQERVFLENRDGVLYFDGREVKLFHSPLQYSENRPKESMPCDSAGDAYEHQGDNSADVIIGRALRSEGKQPLDENVWDALLTHPHLFPEDWSALFEGSSKEICFFGTEKRMPSDRLEVRTCTFDRGSGKWIGSSTATCYSPTPSQFSPYCDPK